MTEPTPLPRGPMHLLPASHYARQYLFDAPAQTTIEHIRDPRWWAAVAGKMMPGDELIIRAEDLSWRAAVIVLAANRQEAFVQVLTYDVLDLNAAKLAEDANPYYVKWAGRGGFRVHRVSDNEVVKSDFPTKAAAEQWVRNHMKAAA